MAFTINHEDIWIESVEPLSWRQFYDSSLNYDGLTISADRYSDYRPTKLEFHFSSATMNQSIHVKINYANRLIRLHAKHAIVCMYDSSLSRWMMIPHTLNTVDKTFEFSATHIGIYCVFVNHYWYSSFTQRMADEYPNWTKIRQDTKSTGQLFLNYFGIEFEFIKDYLEWIQEQKYIETADVQTLDWISMYQLTDIQTTDTISFSTLYGVNVPVIASMKEFFYNEQNQGGMIDYQEMRFYSVKNHGNLQMAVIRKDNETTYEITPMDFHIWNSFDEFGLLLGVERLHLEKNADYKERILDVFRYPSGTHDIGLTNGIARELNLIQRKDRFGKKLVWQNDQKDFYLKNVSQKKIDIQTLRVDNQRLAPEEYQIDEQGNIYLFAKKQDKSHTISFIYGIDKYQLYDKTHEDFQKMMFQVDGQATPTLLNWVEYINTVAPIMWGHFKWDEGFWDTIDKQATGLGYVPNIWDSNIEVWKEYVFESER